MSERRLENTRDAYRLSQLQRRYRETPESAIAAYAPPQDGPFRCDHCRHQTQLICHQPAVIREARDLRWPDTTSEGTRIDAAGCCNQYESIG